VYRGGTVGGLVHGGVWVRLTLLAVGSRGDVQPTLAVGRELADGGQDVRIVTHPTHERLCALAGVPFFPLAEGPLAATKEVRTGRSWGRWRGHALVIWPAFAWDARAVVRERLDQVLQASAGSDAIIASAAATLLGWQTADYFGIPLIRVAIDQPLRLVALHGPLTRAARKAIWLWYRTWLNGARNDVGLPKLGTREPIGQLEQRRVLWLRAYSPAVGPMPVASRDWVRATGFWFIDRPVDPPPPPELVSFVDAGPPPLCIGFGGLELDDPRPMIRLAIGALAGRRGVLVHHAFGKRGYELPANVFGVGSVPHDWLLPRCAAVVHHCGSGTVGAALRAGAPTVPVPHAGFQMRWARRLHELGVATEPIPDRRLNVNNLRAGLTEATDDSGIRHRVAALQRVVAAERGTAKARRLIEEYLDQSCWTKRSA
jgi:UDP:flavonoid glycosyltransferase YjiC (YdhE family)